MDSIAYPIRNLVFTVSLLHIKAHWRWYKSLVRGNKCHSKITMGLSVAYLLTIVTAIILILQKVPQIYIGAYYTIRQVFYSAFWDYVT